MSFSHVSSLCRIVYPYIALMKLTNHSHILMLVKGSDFKNPFSPVGVGQCSRNSVRQDGPVFLVGKELAV